MLKQIVLGAFAATVAATSVFAADRGSLLESSPFTGTSYHYHYADFSEDFCNIGDTIIKGPISSRPFVNMYAFKIDHRKDEANLVTDQRTCKAWVNHAFEDFFDRRLKEQEQSYGWIAGSPIGGAAGLAELGRANQHIVDELHTALQAVKDNGHIPVENWSDYDRRKSGGKGLNGYIDHVKVWVNYWDDRVDN